MTNIPQFLPNPEVHALRDQGTLVGVVVKVRDAKPVRSVQPSSEEAVFFELDKDDLPVSITFMEPLETGAACDVILTLVGGEVVGRRVASRVIPRAEVTAIVEAVKRANRELAGSEQQLRFSLSPATTP